MKAPAIWIVVGVNRDEGEPVAWYFDEDEAYEDCRLRNFEQNDEYAYAVRHCMAGVAHP